MRCTASTTTRSAFDAWLTEQGKTRKEFDDESREAAERSVKSQMVLDAIADAEDIRLTDQELTERVIAQAQRAGVPPEQFVAQAQADGQLGLVYADARRTKALFRVLRSATIVDSTGEAVDLADVRRRAAGAGHRGRRRHEAAEERTPRPRRPTDAADETTPTDGHGRAGRSGRRGPGVS